MKVFLYQVGDLKGTIAERVVNDEGEDVTIWEFSTADDPESHFEGTASDIQDWAIGRGLHYYSRQLVIDVSRQTVKWVKL